MKYQDIKLKIIEKATELSVLIESFNVIDNREYTLAYKRELSNLRDRIEEISTN
jgi:hypothetical protein